MTNTSSSEKKSILRELVTMLPAAYTTAGPPLGPLLGQFGVNTPAFCKSFNEYTKVFSEFCSSEQQILIITRILIYEDKTFSFKIEKPTVGFLLRQIRVRVTIDGAHYHILRSLDIARVAQFKFGHTDNPEIFMQRLFLLLGTVSSTGLLVFR